MCRSRRCRRAHEPDEGEINYPGGVRGARPARLDGLDRLRIPAARRAPRTASAGPGRTASCRALGMMTLLATIQGDNDLYWFTGAVLGDSAANLTAMWGRKRKAAEAETGRASAAAAPEGGVSARRASSRPSAPAWSSICTTPRSRGSNCSTRRSIRCSRKSRPESTCSTAASAAATRRGCGSTLSPMSAMGRDKRIYRFVQDTRYGRKVLAETVNIPEIVDAVTKYVAQRMIERERALADGSMPAIARPQLRGAVRAPAAAPARASRRSCSACGRLRDPDRRRAAASGRRLNRPTSTVAAAISTTASPSRAARA